MGRRFPVSSASLDTLNKTVLRESMFWASSSYDDGTYNSIVETLNQGTFVPQAERMNLWDGSFYPGCSADLDLLVFGTGDHNRLVGFYEDAHGTSTSYPLTVTTLSSSIFAGDVSTTGSYTMHGPGALHVFRYDEYNNEFRLVTGAHALAGREVRSVAEQFKLGIDFTSSPVLVVSFNNNDVTAPEMSTLAVLTLDAENGAIITGFDASNRNDADFTALKTIVNVGANTIMLSLSSVDSIPQNTIITLAGDIGPIPLAPNSSAVIWYSRGLDTWILFPHNNAAVATSPSADVSASYIVVGLTSSLANERVLTAGTGITLTDGGANSTLTIASTGGGKPGWYPDAPNPSPHADDQEFNSGSIPSGWTKLDNQSVLTDTYADGFAKFAASTHATTHVRGIFRACPLKQNGGSGAVETSLHCSILHSNTGYL